MKELKFRAWIKAQEKMVEVASIDFKEKTIIYEDKKAKPYVADLSQVELLQYTGVKDSKGNEIFEGDILKCEEYFGGDDETDSTNLLEVKFEDNKFWVDLIGYVGGYDLVELCGDFEVIGNIYENGELLK